MELTMDIAKAIIIGYGTPITEETSLKNVKIGNVSYFNKKTNTPFTYEKSGNRYAIVNLKLISDDGFAKAIDYLRDEEFTDACNQNLSFNASIEDAQELEAVGRANVHITYVDSQEDDDGNTEEVLRVTGCKPVVLKRNKSLTLDALDALIAGEEFTEETVEETEQVEGN